MERAVSTAGYHLVGAVVGRRFSTALRELEELQWHTPEAVQARSEARLGPLLRHAAQNVPFYRETYRRLGLAPDDLRSIRDLARLPVVSKAVIRSLPLDQFLAENVPSYRRIGDRTSGSTGEPLRFYRDREGMAQVLAGRLVFDSWFGLKPTDRSVRLRGLRPMGQPTATGTPTMDRLGQTVMARLRRWYESWTQDHVHLPVINSETAESVYRRIQEYRPDYLTGNTSAVAAVADELRRRDRPLPHRLRAVVVGAETLTPARRHLIEAYFQAPIINRYGLREFGFYIAQSCPASLERFHAHPERVVWETVQEGGTPAAPGEVGRVVVTALDNYVMPFIRYDTGDLAVAGGEPCPCGRGFPVLGPIDGRSTELVHTPAGKIISPVALGRHLFVVNDHVDAVRQYQLVQEALDRVRLLVVPTPELDTERQEQIRQALIRLMGPEMTVLVERVATIGCEPSGKRPIIRSMKHDSTRV
jgi:phenylacetate-CoA ligase